MSDEITTIYELQELIKLKSQLIENLKNRGITSVSEDNTLTELVAQVKNIGEDAMIKELLNSTMTELYYEGVNYLHAYQLSYYTKLKKIDLPNLLQITGNDTFIGDTALEEVYLRNCTSLGDLAFVNCSNIKKLYLPKVTKTTGNSNYTSLRTSNIIESVVYGYGVFAADNMFSTTANTNLKMVVLNYSSLLKCANASYLPKVPLTAGTCFIYVPRNLLETYKAATNYSVYPDQFRAIEDYKDLICTEYPYFEKDFVGTWDNE